jgi:catechol 2,3-dioxygenase-like lactoylglutathione lyase family enzyme
MTSMESPKTAGRRAGEVGIHSLDHFALAVPDLTEARDFYSAFGLEVKTEGSALGVYTRGSAQRWALLLEGPVKRLHHLSFGVFAEDLERFRQRLEAWRIAQLDPPEAVASDGLWFCDLDDILIELRVAPKSSPDRKSHGQLLSSPAGKAGAPKRSQAPRVSPARLSHCLTFTRDVPASIEFYSQVLGLRLSDRSGNDIAFMHGIHGSDHHLIAFARSEAPGLHHCCFNVDSVHEIGLGARQMADAGYSRGWGLGRHVLGSNYFHYVRDPWGSHCEYSCDIDYIGADQDWQPGDHDAEDAFYVWGPDAPIDWTHNYEADPH